MPKFARDSKIDLNEAYGSLLDKHAAMRRNIRTKANLHKAHHCEDQECGGEAPKARCVTDLHFAFCLAPVLDENIESPTFGQVVIHGERFVVLSPQGCAEHQYTDGYNLDLKDARNGRADCEVRWKDIFESFKTGHAADTDRRAARQEAMQKQMGMTAHQRRTMLARQDNNEYKHQQRLATARRARSIREREQNEDDASVAPQNGVLEPPSETVSTSSPEGIPMPAARNDEPDHLALCIGAVTDAEAKAVLSPMWLHDQLFVQDKTHNVGQNTVNWNTFKLAQLKQSEPIVPDASWLQNQLFPDGNTTDGDTKSSQIASSPVEETTTGTESTTERANSLAGLHLRRKETKQLKKQRAAQSRAIARTAAEDMAAQEAQEVQEKAARKGPMKKMLGRLTTYSA